MGLDTLNTLYRHREVLSLINCNDPPEVFHVVGVPFIGRGNATKCTLERLTGVRLLKTSLFVKTISGRVFSVSIFIQVAMENRGDQTYIPDRVGR